MVTILLFIGVTVVLGCTCYGIIRWVLLEPWNQWQRDRKELQAEHLREQRKQALRNEALNSVLAQIGQPEDSGRKAA